MSERIDWNHKEETETAHIIGYISEPCKACSRVRVELYSDGRKICEKCHFDQNTEEYDRSAVKYL